MRKTRSLDAAYFEDLYRADPDPWNFATSAYESRKYADTLAVIGEERAGRAFEMGCSIGVLTRQLAGKCGRLVATELSERALDLMPAVDAPERATSISSSPVACQTALRATSTSCCSR